MVRIRLIEFGKHFCAAVVLMIAGAVWAATESESVATFVQLRTSDSLAWRTAPGSRVTVPIPFPHGASCATLTVTGRRFAASYPNLTADEFSFDLPAADAPERERLYDLTLAFDNGVTNSARLAVVDGYDGTATGRTRCLDDEAGEWPNVYRTALVPVPEGTTLFTVNGAAVETDLAGELGWYQIVTANGQTYDLGFDRPGESGVSRLLGMGLGFTVIFR